MMTENDDTQPINWRSIRESLEWNPVQQESVRLRQRATQYALPQHDASTAADDALTVLAFALGKEQFGIEIRHVRMVRVLPKVTPVPGVPRFYPGVVNLRGQIITVFDLSKFFGGSGADAAPAREVVIIQVNNLQLGLLTTHVHGVQTLQRQAIQAVDYIQYAHGVTSQRLVVLDMEALCEDERLIVGGQEE